MRVTYATWNQLSTHWVDGLVERISLIKHPFSHPIIVHPGFLPFPEHVLRYPELTSIPFHRTANLEVLDLIVGVHDLILFSPFLQWTHDVPGMLAQAHHLLAEGGFFVACFFGQDTLCELKAISAALDLEHTNGLQQRFLPTIHTKDAGMLMQRAGFESTTADVEHLIFAVPSVEVLVAHLRDSGLTNTKKNEHTSHIPNGALPRTFLAEANRAYSAQYPHKTTGLNVTVDLIFMCGWKNSSLKRVGTQAKIHPESC
ncbi:MAG: hypothetical protein V4482_03655 [Pseudomonadota bacterium]